MRQSSWRLRLVLLVTPVLAALTLPAGLAQADPSCPQGAICLWTQPGYTGEKEFLLEPQAVDCTPMIVASASNRTGNLTIHFYSDSESEPESGPACTKEIASLGPMQMDDITPPALAYSID
jgi:hypothetical protein